MMRLNSFIAKTGLCSRRKADVLISIGKIKLNGKVVNLLGVKIIPEKDVVEYKGRILKLKEENTYILLNKPKGYITTTKDEMGRKTVLNLLPQHLRKKRLFPVGRLDKDTTGLLILTDDGELANKLMHPRNKIEKTYIVTLNKAFKKTDIRTLLIGIEDEGEILKAKSLKQNENNQVELTLGEGKKREIKRMFRKLGYGTMEIKRIEYAFLTLQNVEEGKYRELTKTEVDKLKTP